MITNKIKLFIPSHKLLCLGFLSLTFGLTFLFAQNSFAAYTNDAKIATDINNSDVTNKCGALGTTGMSWNKYDQKQFCLFDKSNISKVLESNYIGVTIENIKVPYSFAIALWKTINSAGPTYPYPGNMANCEKETFKRCPQTSTFIPISALSSTFTIPSIFDSVKTEIIRSCLPGKITTTNTSDIYHLCCGISDHANTGFRAQADFDPKNYKTWGYEGCGPLINSIGITVNKSENPKSKRIEVEIGEPFILSWSLSNPSAQCSIKGLNANDPDPTKTLISQITAGEVVINVRTGEIVPKTGQIPFGNPQKGIYTYTIECSGVINGKESPVRDVVPQKSVKVYVGDIPADPGIKFDAIKSADLADFSGSAGANYQIPINRSFKLSWEITNAKSIKLWKQKTVLDKKIILSTKTINNIANPLTLNFEGTDTGGFYTFWLEAEGELPEQKTESRKIIIYAKEAGKVNVPEGQFAADKTEIKRDESVILSWNISGASEVSINQGIGKVQNDGSITVNPNITTAYTLTAKNPIAGDPDTKKTVTIVVKSEEIFAGEPITPFVAPADIEIEGMEKAAKPTIDLRVNGTDGPVTLSAPAKFTLSWNLDTYCLATGSWLSIKTQAGNESVSLNKNGKYTYSLSCPGYGTDSIIVNVVNSSNNGLFGRNGLLGGSGNGGNAINMPTAEASVSTDGINYSQNIKVIKGEEADLYIKINDGAKLSRDASGEWSGLMSNGGFCLYNNNLIKDKPLFNGMIESPESRESCNAKLGTFTFNDEPGTYKYGVFRMLQNDQKFSNISYINITIENPPAPTSGPVIDLKINGNDASEQVLGAPANFSVSWNAVNADTCEASGSWTGSKDMSGTQSFVSSSKKDFVYTLTCVGQLGTTAKSINLKVAEAPVCSFTALPPSINKMSSFITESELSWKCDYSDECDLSPNPANATIKTYGTLRVSPDQTTNYILTCANSNVSKSFEAKVEIIN